MFPAVLSTVLLATISGVLLLRVCSLWGRLSGEAVSYWASPWSQILRASLPLCCCRHWPCCLPCHRESLVIAQVPGTNALNPVGSFLNSKQIQCHSDIDGTDLLVSTPHFQAVLMNTQWLSQRKVWVTLTALVQVLQKLTQKIWKQAMYGKST